MGGGDVDVFVVIVWVVVVYGDDDVVLFVVKYGEVVVYVGVFWVWFDVVKDCYFDFGFLQIMQGFVYCVIFNCLQVFVGDQQGFFFFQQLVVFVDYGNGVGVKKVNVWYQIIKYMIVYNIFFCFRL